MKYRILTILLVLFGTAAGLQAIDNPGITQPTLADGRFTLINAGVPASILVDSTDNVGVRIAARNLSADFGRVCGKDAALINEPAAGQTIIVGTLDCKFIKALVKAGKIDEKSLKGKTEKYILTTVANPFEGIDKTVAGNAPAGVKEALVIAGSDRRGAIYGIYELSEQIGVSPWYDWADVPVVHQDNLSIAGGEYTAGEPAVRYRGIFLNDEAPCLTSWVENTYGTKYGDHRFYGRVFELLLRLRGNFMWPAMWGWSFYADDPENSKTADDMGIIMGTSHHEPMARNHQEWARNRGKYGVWDYANNQKVIDKFFREGIERCASTEDLITIGMRGDGDTSMGGKEGKDDEAADLDDYNMKLLRKIFKNQRKIIADVTGEKAEKRPQVWALYKEVQNYYDKGLSVPDDVIMLVCDDNWGNVRKLPNAEERKHPGGWGMYYHVDYVGAPRNSKWLNCTPPQNLCEQMRLTYDYGVDKLWILNVGDLKPMEYPITLFLDMAWNPTKFRAPEVTAHLRDFCARQFGEAQADEAARILNLQCKYAGRVTPEMLDAKTYNVSTGEWKQVADDYARLEAEALRQYLTLDPTARDAYKQLILFPVQAMSNLYDMYYAQAMNHKLYAENNPRANEWADRVERDFARDAALCLDYNKNMAGGKWDGMMTQKHIGYTSWHDGFEADTLPEIFRVGDTAPGHYVFSAADGVVAIEAEHFNSAEAPEGTEWTVIPYMGRTLSGVSLTPYDKPAGGSALKYKMQVSNAPDSLDVLVVVKSTLAFANPEGHRFAIGFEGAPEKIVNFNGELNEKQENVYRITYPTVARRVIENKVRLAVPGGSEKSADGKFMLTLVIKPLEPGTVFEKIVVDCGGYQKSYLHMPESPCRRELPNSSELARE